MVVDQHARSACILRASLRNRLPTQVERAPFFGMGCLMPYESKTPVLRELQEVSSNASELAKLTISGGANYFIAASDLFSLDDRLHALNELLDGSLSFYSNKKHVPYSGSVYVLISEGDIVYVGQTECTYRRIRSHNKKYNFDLIAVIQLPMGRLLQAECLAIALLTPKGNFLCDKKYDCFSEKDHSKVISHYASS